MSTLGSQAPGDKHAPVSMGEPPAQPEARRAPRVVSIALVVVLGGTALLAVQNCGADSPGAQPPSSGPSATAAPKPPDPVPPQPPPPT